MQLQSVARQVSVRSEVQRAFTFIVGQCALPRLSAGVLSAFDVAAGRVAWSRKTAALVAVVLASMRRYAASIRATLTGSSSQTARYAGVLSGLTHATYGLLSTVRSLSAS